MNAVDTSVVIAAFASWHEFHGDALDACDTDPVLPAHAYVEAYSTLTRMPEPFRAPGDVVADYLGRRWSKRLIVPSRELLAELPRRPSDAGLIGGAAYDGLIAVTAQGVERRLLSFDRRAQRTYARLGVDHQLLPSPVDHQS